MGIVVCTLHTEQDEVLCCWSRCRCSSCCCLCCSCCRHCCSCRPCCCHLCSCCPSCCHLCSCCPCCCHLCSCCTSCCCHRPCCPPSWLQCPPPGPPCSPGLCPEACFHPHHQQRDQPRPSCCCCLNICRRAGLKQDNKTFILNLSYQT